MVKITTKKLPVSISYGKYQAKSHEFLIPPLTNGVGEFQGLISGKPFLYGALSYLGKDITVNDLFAKLVDSGRKIESVERTVAVLQSYLRMLQDYKIGNILAVEACSEEPCGFRLKKIADAPPVKPINLP
jgi:hypothetical protein